MADSKYELLPPVPKRIENDLNLLQNLRKAFQLPLLENYPNQLFNQIPLSEGSLEYTTIYNRFSATIDRYTVSRINKIENPFILLHYHIARSQFLTQNDDFEEEYYFHGTEERNLNSICNFNFDRSKVLTRKFGNGISFAKTSRYATSYPKSCKKMYYNKVMVVAKLYYNKPLECGSQYTIVPKAPAYTSKNESGSVLVKYDDASYYPAYVIYYNKKYQVRSHDEEYEDFYDDYFHNYEGPTAYEDFSDL